MVVIRLARAGSKKNPFYNVVATDSRSPRDGRFIEKIGFYNPIARGQEVALRLMTDKYNHWVEKGAKPSNRVASLYALWLQNNSQDVAARIPKADRTPIDINDKPAQRKVKVVEPEQAEPVEAEQSESVEAEQAEPVEAEQSESVEEVAESAEAVSDVAEEKQDASAE